MEIVRILPFALAAALVGCQTARRPAPDTLIAHRGESADAPENTLPAFRMAVDRGFGFECDLYLSSDGRVFAFHDRDLSRTTGGANTNRCADVSWSETLSKLDVGSWGRWADSRYRGTPPALLEDILALARPGRKIYLELKAGPEIVPAVKEVLAAQDRATPDTVLFISFSEEVCRAVKEQLPAYRVYWLTGSDGMTAGKAVAGARAAQADGVDMKFDPDLVTEAFVSEVKGAGLSFHVWTVNDLALALRAFAVGADTVTTDCAKRLYDEYRALFEHETPERDPFADRIRDGAAFPTLR